MGQTCFPFSHPHSPPEQQSWSCGRSWVWCAWCIFCGWEEDHEAGWDLEDHSLFHSFFSPATRPVGGACLKWAWIQIFRDFLSAVCHCGTLMPNYYFEVQKPCLKIGSIWNLPLFVPSNFCCRNREIIKPEQSHKGNVTHVLFAKLLEMLKASCCHTEPHRGFASPEHSQAGAEDLWRRKHCAIIHSWNHDP